MKIRIKAVDDAVSTSGQIMSTVTGWLNKLGQLAREFERYEVDYNEYRVDLSTDSPYAKLTKEQRMYKAELNKVRGGILPYMYLEDELKQYEQDYQNLLAAIEKFKEHAKKRLQQMVSAIQNMPAKRKEERDKKELQSQVTNVKQEFKSAKQNDPEAETVKTVKNNIFEYITKVADMIELDDNEKQQIAQAFKGYRSLDEIAKGITNVVNLIK